MINVYVQYTQRRGGNIREGEQIIVGGYLKKDVCILKYIMHKL